MFPASRAFSRSLRAKTQIGELSDLRTIDTKSRGNNESRIEVNLLGIIHGISRGKRKPRRKLRPSRLLKIAAGLVDFFGLRLGPGGYRLGLMRGSSRRKNVSRCPYIQSIPLSFQDDSLLSYRQSGEKFRGHGHPVFILFTLYNTNLYRLKV